MPRGRPRGTPGIRGPRTSGSSHWSKEVLTGDLNTRTTSDPVVAQLVSERIWPVVAEAKETAQKSADEHDKAKRAEYQRERRKLLKEEKLNGVNSLPYEKAELASELRQVEAKLAYYNRKKEILNRRYAEVEALLEEQRQKPPAKPSYSPIPDYESYQPPTGYVRWEDLK